MECTEAQQVLSAAYDGEPTDPELLRRAEEHCGSCAECAAFADVLAELRALPGPEMPADAAERTLEALRAEYSALAPHVIDTAPPAGEELAGVPPLARFRRPAWAPWAVAAAALFIVAGIVTAQGVRYLIQPSPDALRSSEVGVADAEFADDTTADAGIDGTEEPALAPELSAEAPSGPAFVVFGQATYRFTGTIQPVPDTIPIGSVTSSLDTPSPAASRAVYADPSSDSIVVAADADSALVFEPVTRLLRGTPYVLRSGSITSFGQWPELPADVAIPSSPDGSPSLIEAGSDDLGVTVYVRPGTDTSAGFAVAPGVPPSDPAAGIPGWTWWEPRR